MKYTKHALATPACALILVFLLAVGNLSVRASQESGGLAPRSKTPVLQPGSLNVQESATEPSRDPLWISPAVQTNQPTRIYVVRVIDSESKQPISHAKVWVEIGDPPEKRNGYTDSRGAFSFRWRLAGTGTKAHITVESEGYMTVQTVSVLIEDRIIQLSKATKSA